MLTLHSGEPAHGTGPRLDSIHPDLGPAWVSSRSEGVELAQTLGRYSWPKSRQAQQGMSRDLFFDCSQMRAAPDEARASLLEPGVITRAGRGVQLLRSTASFTFERGRGGERLE
ncbi:hypothetical protein MHYP_G00037230 [Metynnis hypsauchen]